MRRPRHQKVPANLAMCSLLALGACTEKNKEPEAEATDPAAAVDAPVVKVEAAASPAMRARPAALTTVLPHEKGVVFGHFLVADGAALLKEVKEQLMIPAYKGFLDEAALRSMASLQLPEKRKQLAQNIEISSVFGCAMVDFKVYGEAPVACTFGYKGGTKAFLEHLGNEDQLADKGEHLAKYRLEGQDLYVDELGDHVVITTHPEVYARTKEYLQTNLLDRAGKIRGDFEAVAYVGEALEFYRADLQPLIDEYENMQEPGLAGDSPNTGHPGLDAATKIWLDYNKQSTKRSVESLGELAQVSIYGGVEKVGLVGGFAAVPVPGSKLETTAKKTGGARVDPQLMASVPDRTVFLGATAMKPESFENDEVKEGRALASKAWAALTGGDAAKADARLQALTAEYRELYSGHSAAALVHVESSPLFGLMLAADLQADKSARASFLSFTREFTPQALLGQEFSQYVSWKFETDAFDAGGTKVDRFVLEPTAMANELLEKEMSERDKAEVDKWLGGLRVEAHRSELGGRVIWTAAPKAEETFTRQVLDAQRGKGAIDPAMVSRLMALGPESNGLFALDIKRGIAWLKSLDELASEMGQVPDDLGTDLSDVVMTAQNRTDGVFLGELVISQEFIEQGKDVAANQGL